MAIVKPTLGAARDFIGADGKLSNVGTHFISDVEEKLKSLSTWLDSEFGDDRGTLLHRGETSWGALAPGTSGHFLQSNGAGADLSYAANTPPVWKLVEPARTVDGEEAFTDLGVYQEIFAILRAVTATNSGTRAAQVSIDNGANYLTSSGDYETFNSSGVTSNQTAFHLGTVSGTTAVTLTAHIRAFNVAGTPKIGLPPPGANPTFIDTTSALNAIKFINTAGTPNGGTIYLLGLPSS